MPRVKGRPTVFRKELTDQLLGLIAVGTPIMMACQGAGIAYRTFRDWMVAAERGEEPYAAFYMDVQKAQGLAVATRLQRLQEAAKKGAWQADAWWLERKYPKDFGLRHEISGPEGGPIQITDTGRDLLLKRLEEMHERQNGVKLLGDGSDRK